MAAFDTELLDALEQCAVPIVTGSVWRQVLEPTPVEKVNTRGARWNRPGTEALYCSLDPATAAAEIDNLLAAQIVPIKRQRLTYRLDVRLTNVADLRTQPLGGIFDYPYDLSDMDLCQIIGAASFWLGQSAIIVPSIRNTGDNLAIYPANMAPDDFYEPADHYPYPQSPHEYSADALHSLC